MSQNYIPLKVSMGSSKLVNVVKKVLKFYQECSLHSAIEPIEVICDREGGRDAILHEAK